MFKARKKIINILSLCFAFTQNIAQIIPFGVSVDSLTIKTPVNTRIYEGNYGIHYYKPASYNALTSPILFFIHGTGGNGAVSIDLQSIADRQNALIVAPTMHNGQLGWAYATEVITNTVTSCNELYWYTQVTKEIYRHILSRESRGVIDVYLTGFSAGAQFTTRYMLIRQFSPDSIPIKMAVSVNPANYTLMTDTFNNTQMLWNNYRCGLAGFEYFGACLPTPTIAVKDFICNEHIKQYYNENYGVLCGTADTQAFTGFCPGAQGTDRWDRTKKFWVFSTTNAVSRGTTLKWVMDSVVGVGHDQINMYNTKRNSTDTFTIAERLLFKTPFHTVQQYTPTCVGGVGINDLAIKDISFSVYPNPSNSECFIKFNRISNSKENVKIEVSNSLGQQVAELYNSPPSNNEIQVRFDTKSLSSGLYFIKTTCADQIKIKKLVIEH